MLSKGLAVAVIILFLGLAINPSVAVETDTSDSEEECDICPSVKVNNNAMNDRICTLIALIQIYMGLRGASMGVIYNLLSLLPLSIFSTIYKEYALIRTSHFLYIYDEILNPLYREYECDYWPYQINIDR